jgi:hypothetical protein
VARPAPDRERSGFLDLPSCGRIEPGAGRERIDGRRVVYRTGNLEPPTEERMEKRRHLVKGFGLTEMTGLM